MHNRILFCSTILTAFLAVACAKADVEKSDPTPQKPDGGGQVITLRSTIEGSDGTKVKLSKGEGTMYSLRWEDNDKFRVVCEGAASPSTFSLTDDPNNPQAGIFSGELPQGSSENYYAVVNYLNNDVSVSDNSLSLYIGQDNSAWANNIYAYGIPLVAKVESGGATFHHIFGLLELKLSATEPFLLKKIAVHDLAGNMLWGTCSVPIKNDGSLDHENVTMTGGDNTITMTLNSGREIGSTSTSYYIPVPKGALEGGFSVVLYEATDNTKDSEVARTYSFMQKITGTKAMPRAGILSVNAAVTAKPESLDEKGRGYYKSLFVNAGKSLDGFVPNDEEDGIPAIEYMGLDNDYEYLNTSNANTQTSVLIENSNDANGVLLYPDGSPRFRLVFNRGGNSIAHGTSLGATGRGRFKTFFDNGGSYSGVCAGAFLAAETVSSAHPEEGEDADFTFHLIPVKLTHTSLPNGMSDYKGIYTNMAIRDNAKSIISSLNGDGKFSALTGTSIADVMHHGGGFLPYNQSLTTGVEALMTYQFSETHGSTTEPFPGDKKSATYDDHYYRSDNIGKDIYNSVNRVNEYSTWAYKNTNGKTGRAVCSGSHPEVPGKDSDKQFTGFMFRYAMEGNGDAVVKSGDLTLGQTRYMNATPSDYTNPADNNAGIGDGQYHHFKFEVPAGGYDNIVLRLDSDCDSNSGIDLYLGLRRQVSTDGTKDLAWLSDADYTLCNKGGKKEIRIKNLPAGDWYVSVFCATKVTASQGENSCSYSGKTQVLNGVPYSICIAKDGTIKDLFPSAFGEDSDDFTNSMDD